MERKKGAQISGSRQAQNDAKDAATIAIHSWRRSA